MAEMIPDSVPSKASQGEKTLFGLLRDGLPDDFIVWYEPQVKNLHPDFVILAPTFGLLILEVKGWRAGDIEQANSNHFQVRWNRGGSIKVEAQTSPLRQAHSYITATMDKLLGYPVLCNPDGDYQGKLTFPVGGGVVMSKRSDFSPVVPRFGDRGGKDY